VFVGNVDRLEKRITRAYRRTLFGSLSNVWLFDRAASSPTRPTPAHWHCCHASAHRLTACGCWCGTPARRCSTTGARPCWNCCKREMLARLPFALGPLEGHRLAIDVPALTLALGS
jgi:hypothetical protein